MNWKLEPIRSRNKRVEKPPAIVDPDVIREWSGGHLCPCAALCPIVHGGGRRHHLWRRLDANLRRRLDAHPACGQGGPWSALHIITKAQTPWFSHWIPWKDQFQRTGHEPAPENPPVHQRPRQRAMPFSSIQPAGPQNRQRWESPGSPAARAAGFNRTHLQPHPGSYADSCSTSLACQPACTARNPGTWRPPPSSSFTSPGPNATWSE